MANSQNDSEWDKSTSEIQSEDSDDLFESRPNRWRGPPQSWRTLTEEDRLTFTASERLRNQDLSVHLYNAFALKHRPRTPLQQDASADVQPAATGAKPWAPPKSWTAWPLQASLVPPDDFMKRTEDEDEAFTFRNAEPGAPSNHLEEVVSAAILKCAKDKFRKRQLGGAQGALNEKLVKNEPISSGNESAPSQFESTDDDEDNAAKEKSQRTGDKIVERTYKPAIATDDDLSYALIRPSTRAILAKLDQTLTILHNARANSAGTTMDSTLASSASDGTEDDLYNEAAPSVGHHRSRSRAQSRSQSRGRASVASTTRSLSRDSRATATTASPGKEKTSSRGRKATFVPREGESERDFLRRRAKAQRKRQPVFSEDEEGAATTDGRSTSKRKQTRRLRRGSENNRIEEYWKRKKLDRFHLRDWSDVMGAAALAGFDAKVIERATQRCADLFGQGMEMHTITENTKIQTSRFVPGQVVLSSDSEDEDQDKDRQSRTTSRYSSLAQSRAVSLVSAVDDDDGDENEADQRGMESSRKRQKRSSSRGSVLNTCYCHHADCERAIRSFSKPSNLRRHLKAVHGETGEKPVSTPLASAANTSTAEGGTTKPEALFCCHHAGCERATRPFDKGHNLRRHLERVHGEGIAAGASATGPYLCPHAGCERATRAFDRRPNLARHLKLVHGIGNEKGRGRNSREQSGTEASLKHQKESPRSGESSEESESENGSSTESHSGSQSEGS